VAFSADRPCVLRCLITPRDNDFWPEAKLGTVHTVLAVLQSLSWVIIYERWACLASRVFHNVHNSDRDVESRLKSV